MSCFVVVRERNGQGSYVLKSRIGKHLAEFTRSLEESLPREGIQVMVVSRPTAYGEYAPYTMADTEEELRKIAMAM